MYPNLNMLAYHIPRCAGNSFKYYLMSLYGLSVTERKEVDGHEVYSRIVVMGDLYAESETINWDSQRYSDKLLFDNESKVNIEIGDDIYRYGDIDFDLIMGHFGITKYADLNKHRVVWLRDPLERAISEFKFTALAQRHYFYTEDDYDRESEINGIGRMIFKEKMDINDVLNSDIMTNVLTQYVGDDLDDFSFVGTVENFDKDLNRFQKMYGLKEETIDKSNTFDWMTSAGETHCQECHDRFQILKQPIDQKRFYATHERDYELYSRYK